jgi:hypothetical protein
LLLNKKVDQFQLCLKTAASLFPFSCKTFLIGKVSTIMPATMTHWVLKLKIEIILSVALAEVAKASTVTCRWSLALIPTNVTNVKAGKPY